MDEHTTLLNLKQKYPDRVLIICRQMPGSKLPPLRKKGFLVQPSMQIY
jgi:hypothetical protein